MSSPGSVQSAAWWLATESLTSDQSGGHSAMTKAERTGETSIFMIIKLLFLFLSNKCFAYVSNLLPDPVLERPRTPFWEALTSQPSLVRPRVEVLVRYGY